MSEMFDDLKKLSEMLEKGEITQAEYEKLKADLLGEKAAPAEPVDPMAGKPSGWYDDPTGKSDHQAFWDDKAWTGLTRPRPTPTATPPSLARRAGMAMGKKIPKLASTLPELPTAKPDKEDSIFTKTWFWLVAAIVILLITLNVCGGGSGGRSTPTVNNGSEVGAYVVCQQFVEDRLKSPSSAEFGGPYSQVTQTVSTGRYRVSTYVDAQNSFGAMIRTDFVCEVTHTSGDSYHLESLVMDE